jgi:tetratricopeptide (TPR) repeat protein
MPSSEVRPLSRAAAERAIQIDPDLAEAHVALGAYKMFYEWDLDGAERHYRRAMELNVDYAVPHELLAYVLRARGRHEEAIAEARRATELDPLHLLMLGDLAVCNRFAGNVEKSIEIHDRLLEMDPNFGDAYFENALAHSQLGHHDVALEGVMKALSLTGNSTKVKAGLGMVYAQAGKTANAQGVIDELLAESKERYVSPMDIALVYSTMGEKDKAFEWLEKAYDERTPWMFEVNVTPELSPLRNDPRFQDLLRRVGLIGG